MHRVASSQLAIFSYLMFVVVVMEIHRNYELFDPIVSVQLLLMQAAQRKKLMRGRRW